MTVYQKVAGDWGPGASQVYVKRNGVWTIATRGYVKRSGVWTQSYIYDVVPPNAPELSISLVSNTSGGKVIGRWAKVGVRTTVNDPDIRRIRVLTTYNNAYPTTYLGGTYTGGADTSYPGEPWSDWYFNGFSGSTRSDSSVFTYKEWPRNSSGTFMAPAGTDYKFTAWAEDFGGNWSVPVTQHLTIPSATSTSSVIHNEARFQPLTAGSLASSGYTDGRLEQSWNQSNSTYSLGLWFYGTQIATAIGKQGTPTISNAQIRVERRADDGGSANANVYLFRHPYNVAGAVPPTGRAFSETTFLGTVAKGEAKWFQIPPSMWPDMQTGGVKGFGLYYKDPAKASAFAADYSVLNGVADSPRTGEVVVAWTEQL